MKYLVGTSSAQSARATTLLQDQLTARFERVLEVEIARAMGEMIDQYEVTRATPALPVEHEARMAEIWAQMANVSIRAFGGRVLEYGVKHCNPYTIDNGKTWSLADNGGYTFETKSFAELFARLSLEYISSEMIRARITMVSETLRQNIVNVIGAGQAAGSTLPEISKQLRTLSRVIPRFRAAMIARTEVHGAANYGADEAAKATGLKLRKEWVAVGDGRTRDEHGDMDGEIVDMDQSFNFGSYRLMYPGDRSGPARGVINCRCQIAHVVDDEFGDD